MGPETLGTRNANNELSILLGTSYWGIDFRFCLQFVRPRPESVMLGFDLIQHRAGLHLRRLWLELPCAFLAKLSQTKEQVALVRRVRQAVLLCNDSTANHFFDLTVECLHTFGRPLIHRVQQ